MIEARLAVGQAASHEHRHAQAWRLCRAVGYSPKILEGVASERKYPVDHCRLLVPAVPLEPLEVAQKPVPWLRGEPPWGRLEFHLVR